VGTALPARVLTPFWRVAASDLHQGIGRRRMTMSDVVNVPMKAWPLFMNCRVPVSGNGFRAGVTIKSRGLLVLEDDGDGEEYHLYGVNPGGLCSRGATPEEANNDFMVTLRAAMFDIADEAADFNDFKLQVESLLAATNDFYEKRWQESLALVRKNALNLPGAPRESGDTQPSVTVVALGEPKPADNTECATLATAA
jgi:hypothetical protein